MDRSRASRGRPSPTSVSRPAKGDTLVSINGQPADTATKPELDKMLAQRPLVLEFRGKPGAAPGRAVAAIQYPTHGFNSCADYFVQPPCGGSYESLNFPYYVNNLGAELAPIECMVKRVRNMGIKAETEAYRYGLNTSSAFAAATANDWDMPYVLANTRAERFEQQELLAQMRARRLRMAAPGPAGSAGPGTGQGSRRSSQVPAQGEEPGFFSALFGGAAEPEPAQPQPRPSQAGPGVANQEPGFLDQLFGTDPAPPDPAQLPRPSLAPRPSQARPPEEPGLLTYLFGPADEPAPAPGLPPAQRASRVRQSLANFRDSLRRSGVQDSEEERGFFGAIYDALLGEEQPEPTSQNGPRPVMQQPQLQQRRSVQEVRQSIADFRQTLRQNGVAETQEQASMFDGLAGLFGGDDQQQQQQPRADRPSMPRFSTGIPALPGGSGAAQDAPRASIRRGTLTPEAAQARRSLIALRQSLQQGGVQETQEEQRLFDGFGAWLDSTEAGAVDDGAAAGAQGGGRRTTRTTLSGTRDEEMFPWFWDMLASEEDTPAADAARKSIQPGVGSR